MKRIIASAMLLQLAFGLQAGATTEEEKSGFEGSTGVGPIFIYSGDNLNPQGSKKAIDNLNSAAKKELTVLPLVLPNIDYNFGKPSEAKLTLTSQPAIDEAGDYSVNLGGTLPLYKA